MKLDAHQHFWDLERLSYPWLSPTLRPLYRTFEPPDLEPLLSAVGIDGTIVVQATHMEAETAWFLSLARAHPFIKGVVGWLDLTAGDLAEKASRFMAEGPLCGVRHQVHDEPAVDWLLQPDVIRGLKTIAGLGLAYDLLVRPQHLPVLPALFDAVPDMRWVIDHIAKPPIASGQVEPWLTGMRQAARFPNVFCKVSGMITEADHAHWTVGDLRPYFEHVLELFGPSRLLWGSDWPVCLLAGSYTQVHDLVAELIEPLSADERAAIWGGTARELYKLAL